MPETSALNQLVVPLHSLFRKGKKPKAVYVGQELLDEVIADINCKGYMQMEANSLKICGVPVYTVKDDPRHLRIDV